MQIYDEPRDQLDADCLYHMTDALRCASKNKWKNAGSYDSLFWIQKMVTPNLSLDHEEAAVILYGRHPEAFDIFVAAYNAATIDKMIDEGEDDIYLLKLSIPGLPESVELAQKLAWYEAREQFQRDSTRR